MGEENNLITGGMDADQFWLVTDESNLPATPNIITDFSSAEGDVMGLANTSLDFNLNLVSEGDNTIVRALGTDLAVLSGVGVAQISESDFLFL